MSTKILTLTQPWATLVAIGAKRVETRSWRTSYRGPLIIHAAKTYKPEDQAFANQNPFVAEAFEQVGIPTTELERLPLGKLVGAAKLLVVQSTDDEKKMQRHFCPAEEAFGNFGPGRWIWVLDNPLSFPDEQRKPYSGRLGLRDFDDPDLMLWLTGEGWPHIWRPGLAKPWELNGGER